MELVFNPPMGFENYSPIDLWQDGRNDLNMSSIKPIKPLSPEMPVLISLSGGFGGEGMDPLFSSFSRRANSPASKDGSSPNSSLILPFTFSKLFDSSQIVVQKFITNQSLLPTSPSSAVNPVRSQLSESRNRLSVVPGGEGDKLFKPVLVARTDPCQ
jgi:hypothetical protein